MQAPEGQDHDRHTGQAGLENFSGSDWKNEINVRDFIVSNMTPYADDPEFLAKPTQRTLAVWKALQPLFHEEIKKSVLDVDPSTPATLTAFGPGFIDKNNEGIVGLQADKPFKHAILPTGGFRMVEAGLKGTAKVGKTTDVPPARSVVILTVVRQNHPNHI
jgi:formate C-acetyltransferase